MKQFNLEEYLDNPSRKVVTRDGKDARIICTDAKSEKYQVVALVTKKGGQEILATFDSSGKYRSGYNSHLDLFFTLEKHEGWINIYKHEDGHCEGDGNIYSTEEEASKLIVYSFRYQYLTTVKIEWEEQL